MTDLRPARVDHQADRAFSASVPDPSSDSGDPDFLDQLTRGQIRRILESSAINDLTDTVPELVETIAHSSHTNATLASAWRDFQEATRAAHALHLVQRAWWELYCQQDLGACPEAAAAEIKQGQADDAWYLITNRRARTAAGVAGGLNDHAVGDETGRFPATRGGSRGTCHFLLMASNLLIASLAAGDIVIQRGRQQSDARRRNVRLDRPKIRAAAGLRLGPAAEGR